MRHGMYVFLMGCFLFLVFSAQGAFAAVDFTKVKVAQKPGQKTVVSPFFKTLEPRGSSRGAVKTFVVRKVAPTDHMLARVKKPAEVNLKIAENFRKSGTYAMPVSGEISSLFGYRSDPFRRRIRVFHAGVDIRAPTGTPIYATAPGKVVFAGWRRGYGLTIRIDHGNGLETAYAHCSRLIARLGATVPMGVEIASVGRTGSTTGSHLHFEVYNGGSLVNPMSILKR